MRIAPLFTSLSALLPISLAAQLTLNLAPSPSLLPNPSLLPPTTHAKILSPDGQILSSLINRRNELSFPSLHPGSHLLSIFTRDLIYPQYRIDVVPLADSSSSSLRETIEVVQTYRGNTWDNKGPRLGSGNDTLTVAVVPVARKEFYQERVGFSVLSLLKNPMILMAVVSAGLVFGMPYLLENMDPETKAEFEEAQKNNPMASGDAAAALQNFDFAGWLAGGSKTASGGGDGQKSSGKTESLR